MTRSNKQISLQALIASLLLLLAACDKPADTGYGTLMNRYQAVDYKGWEDRDTLVIGLPPVDSTLQYHAEYGVRLLRDYAYTNLQIRVWVEEMDEKQRRITIHRLYGRNAIRYIPDSTHMDVVATKYSYTLLRTDTTADTIQHIRTTAVDKISFSLFEANKKGTRQSPTFATSTAKGKDILLKKDKTYRLKIVHNMRERNIKGVTNIGVKLDVSNGAKRTD